RGSLASLPTHECVGVRDLRPAGRRSNCRRVVRVGSWPMGLTRLLSRTLRGRTMAIHKVVVRFQDGRMLKGSTADFVPTKDRLHLSPADAPPGAKPVEVQLAEVKALFFVHDFAGKPRPQKDPTELPPPRPGAGRGIRVMFRDGEILVGTTHGYQP